MAKQTHLHWTINTKARAIFFFCTYAFDSTVDTGQLQQKKVPSTLQWTQGSYYKRRCFRLYSGHRAVTTKEGAFDSAVNTGQLLRKKVHISGTYVFESVKCIRPHSHNPAPLCVSWNASPLGHDISKSDSTREGHRQSDEPFHMQHWGNLWETGRSSYGLFRARRYHIELNWAISKKKKKGIKKCSVYIPVTKETWYGTV